MPVAVPAHEPINPPPFIHQPNRPFPPTPRRIMVIGLTPLLDIDVIFFIDPPLPRPPPPIDPCPPLPPTLLLLSMEPRSETTPVSSGSSIEALQCSWSGVPGGEGGGGGAGRPITLSARAC